jgi:hypothetical protein
MAYVELTKEDRELLLRAVRHFTRDSDYSRDAVAVEMKRVGDKLFREKSP